MKVKIPLILELKRSFRIIEKGQKGTVSHLVECMKDLGWPPGLGGVDFQCSRQFEAEKILLELPGFLRIPATVGIMVESFDHGIYLAERCTNESHATPIPTSCPKKRFRIVIE